MLRVTCAIIRNEDDEVLSVQRGGDTDHPFKWEFPGGKVMEGESDEECIIREIREELTIDIVICSRMEEVDYDYGKKHILLIPFVCDTLDDLPVLTEHADFRWMPPSRLRDLDFSEADVLVAENYLKSIRIESVPEPLTTNLEVDSADDDVEFSAMVSSTMGASEVEWIAASAVENPVIFRKLLRLSFSEEKKLAFHSSWALAKVADTHPDLFTGYLVQIIGALEKLGNESSLRSFLRILMLSDISQLNSRHQGLLTDYCFSALRSGTSSIAVKAYSMEIIYKMALIYPGLVHELVATINMLHGESSAGIVARGNMIIRRLSEGTRS